MNENNNQNSDQVLLHMHQFYAQEAHHQRTMMWETVKWFTPVLLLIAGGWIKYFIDEFLVCKNLSILLFLLILSIFGFCLSYCCILLIRSFYKTNLINITMYAKVEEELSFDHRNKSQMLYFSGDKKITWEDYRESRKGNEPQNGNNNKNEKKGYTSKTHVEKKLIDKYLPLKKASIFTLMKCVFVLFCLGFLVCFLVCIIFLIARV